MVDKHWISQGAAVKCYQIHQVDDEYYVSLTSDGYFMRGKHRPTTGPYPDVQAARAAIKTFEREDAGRH